MYEHKLKPVLPKPDFYRRMAFHIGIVLALICVSLGTGIVCYHELAGLGWVDAFLNASMILGGMGPVDTLPNNAAKIFASFYALYSGLVLLVSVGILFAPIFHRFLHKFHFPVDNNQ